MLDADTFPPETIEFATHRKVILEKPQRGSATAYMAGDLGGDWFYPYPYAVELSTQQLVDRFETAITMRGAALYNYARFEGDSDLEAAKTLRSTHTESHPASLRDHVLLILFGWIRKFVYLVSKKTICKDQLPKWLYPAERTLEVLDEQGIQVERIQEALLAQIHMLKRLKLKPQAVLASPDIMGDLMAYQTEYQEREITYVSRDREDLRFATLPIIVCPELVQGAIVV